jgi:hypothetical protein
VPHFAFNKTNELGEELVGSYPYQVHLQHEVESNNYDRLSANSVCIKVERMVIGLSLGNDQTFILERIFAQHSPND